MSSNLKDFAYYYIKNLIFEAKLLPGDFLDEKTLAIELNMSRTPIREALQKLNDEKFVKIMPRKYTMVNYISINDVKSLYSARKLFEPKIAEEATPFVDKNKLLMFKKYFLENKDNLAVINDEDWDYKFHTYIASCTNNEIICELVEKLMSQTKWIRVLSNISNQKRLVNSIDEHILVIDALLEGDAKSASDLVLKHLLSSEEGYINIYHNKNYFTL